MKMTYKYWIYYLRGEEGLSLYAYTDDKEIAKSFETFRNMDKFKKRKLDLTKEELNSLARDYQSNYLKIYNIEMFDKQRNIRGTITTPITTTEELTIMNIANNIIYGNLLCKFCWCPIEIFNDDLIEDLCIIKYDKYNDYISKRHSKRTIPDMEADQLGIFIRYFGKTMKNF